MMSKKNAVIFTVIVVLLTNAATFLAANIISIPLGDKVLVAKEDYELLKKFEKLFVVKDIVEDNYVDEFEEIKLVEGAVRGLVSSIGDPYTVYWDPREYEAMNIHTEGEYEGVGLYVEPKDNNIVVVAPIEDTPSEKAGIKPGDIITRINDRDVSGGRLDEAVSMMKGKAGTKVKLTIVRDNSPTPMDFNITRENIILKSVKGEMLENSIGYIRITAFQSNTAASFKRMLKSLEKDKMKGLILDLRNNGGGLLDQCIKVADELLGKGTIVYTIDNNNHKEVADSDARSIDVPLVILVNGGTASASEIVSGAVKDTNSGTLVGTRTFGKGLVQTIVPLTRDDSAVKVTIARYYTPSGVCIQGKGIDPNIEVDLPDELKFTTSLMRAEDVQLKKAIEVIKQQMK